MDDNAKVSKSWPQRLFEVRYPFVYLGLSALWVASAMARFFDPAHAHDPGALVFSIVTGVLALGVGALAIVNIVIGRRGGWPTAPLAQETERAPLAQESDPRLRHTP